VPRPPDDVLSPHTSRRRRYLTGVNEDWPLPLAYDRLYILQCYFAPPPALKVSFANFWCFAAAAPNDRCVGYHKACLFYFCLSLPAVALHSHPLSSFRVQFSIIFAILYAYGCRLPLQTFCTFSSNVRVWNVLTKRRCRVNLALTSVSTTLTTAFELFADLRRCCCADSARMRMRDCDDVTRWRHKVGARRLRAADIKD